MEKYHSRLRNDIEKKVGFKILTTTDARALSSLLLIQGNQSLSLSTLRRFWGLVPSRQPNTHTLNELARFLGHSYFLDYVKSKNRNNQWFNDSEMQRLKYKSRLRPKDFEFLVQQYKEHNSAFYISSLFEHAVDLKNWDYAKDFFDPVNIPLLEENVDVTEYPAKLAYLIFIYINQIPEEHVDSICDNLLICKGFRHYCFYIYVDIINLNHRYGKMIRFAMSLDVDFEEKLFFKLIDGLRHYLNTGATVPVHCSEEELDHLPYVLVGRYYGYWLVCARTVGDTTAENIYWERFLSRIGDKTDIRQYLHEFTHHLVLTKDMERLDYILSKFYDTIFDRYHLHSYLDIFFFNIMDIMVSYSSGDTKRARIIYKNLDLERIRYGSYCDYYLIFYAIIGYHLAEISSKKSKYLKDYRDLTKLTKFGLFDDEYLKNFFDLGT